MKPASLPGDILSVWPHSDNFLTHVTLIQKLCGKTKSLSMVWQELFTCSHMDEDTLVGSQVSKVKQNHVGSDVVNKKSSSLLEAHPLRHWEGVTGWHIHHFLPEP